MSFIVGIESGGKVYMGGDRAISGDDSVVLCAHAKVWRKGGVIFGAAGQLDQLQRVRHVFKAPRFRKGQEPVRYLGRLLAPQLQAFFGEDKDRDLTLLVGAGGLLFYLDGSFSFSRAGPEWAVGSGGDAARAALVVIPEADPRQRCRQALEVAAQVMQSVAPPFDVLSA